MYAKEFEEIFAMAIQRELEAYDFYNGVVKKTQDIFLKQLFTDLAKQEMGHHDLLQKFLYDDTMVMNFPKYQDLKVAETVELPRLSLAMSPSEAISLAMKKEEQAVAFYTNLARACNSAAHKKMYMELAAMEMGHKHTLENAFVDIGYPESF